MASEAPAIAGAFVVRGKEVRKELTGKK